MSEDILGEEIGEGDDKIGEYEGERNELRERHGVGRAKLPNKDLYQGTYKYGKRDGKGLYVFRNGARYDGEWYENLKDGNGIFYYPDGSKYEGEWQSDMKHGYGSYTYPNGDVYEGTWKENKRHGLGTYLFNAIGTRFLGMWDNGIRDGPGQLLHPKNRFYGTWVKDMPLGPGCYVFDPPVDCMIHGEYIHIKDPAFDSVGELEEGGEGEPQVQKGFIPVWRSDHITGFDPTLLPPLPVPVEISDVRVRKSFYDSESEVIQRILNFQESDTAVESPVLQEGEAAQAENRASNAENRLPDEIFDESKEEEIVNIVGEEGNSLNANIDENIADTNRLSNEENLFTPDTSQVDDSLLSSEINKEDEGTTVTDPNTARDTEDLPDDEFKN